MCDWVYLFIRLCESVNLGETGSSFGGHYLGNRRKTLYKTQAYYRSFAVCAISQRDDKISHLLSKLEFTANLEIFHLE